MPDREPAAAENPLRDERGLGPGYAEGVSGGGESASLAAGVRQPPPTASSERNTGSVRFNRR